MKQLNLGVWYRIKRGEKFDVIFTNNIYLIGRTGTELLQKLKRIEGFNTPVIIHTLSDNIDNKFIKLGFNGYLKKLIRQDETIELLKNIL